MMIDCGNSSYVCLSVLPYLNIMNLNEETLKMMKDQVSKLKLLTNELELRDRQLAMFKDTICSIEQQRDQLLYVNQQLSSRLQELTSRASSDRSQLQSVIGGLRDQLEQQTLKASELQQMLSSASKDLRSVAKTRSQLEKSNEEMTREIKIVKEQLRQYAEQTNGTEKDVEALKRQLRQQREVCADHNAEMQSLQEQLAFSQQQLTIFKGKYEEVSRLAEVQLKESAVSKAKIKSLQTVEKEIEELKDSIDVAKQEHRKLAEASNYKDRQILILKQAHIAKQQQCLRESSNLEVDFRSLLSVAESQRKPTEFYSMYSDQFEQLQKAFLQNFQRRQIISAEHSKLSDQLQRAKKDASEKQLLLAELQEELELLKINCANQLRSVEATYESRLQEISVRLKREELELQRLRNSDKDYMAISAELDKLREMAKQDESNYRSELSNLKRQNNHLEDQIRELIPLCEESISAKNSNNSIKLVVCQLLRHLLFVVSRFKQLEVYTALLKGFWNYYEKVHWTIRTIPKLKGIGQFRKAVLAVLAARRLRKMGQKTNEKGKQIHGVKDKIVRKLLQGAMANEENMVESGHIDMLSSMLIGDCESVEQIIAVWSDKFRWKEIKYKSINIGKIASQDVNFLRHSFQSNSS